MASRIEKGTEMRKDWSARRVTALLYLIIVIFPFTFYFVYFSYKEMKNDVKVLQEISFSASTMQRYAITALTKPDLELSRVLDETVSGLKTSMDASGYESAADDYAAIRTCWDGLKKAKTKAMILQSSEQCWNTTQSIEFVVSKLVHQKQKKVANILYIELAILMIIILLVIYFVRTYIHIQEKKHAIYDFETKLYNGSFYKVEYAKFCANAERYSEENSELLITVDGLEVLEQDAKLHLLRKLGALVETVIRESDIACRVDEEHVSILLPHTSIEHSAGLHQRIENLLSENSDLTASTLVFSLQTRSLDKKQCR